MTFPYLPLRFVRLPLLLLLASICAIPASIAQGAPGTAVPAGLAQPLSAVVISGGPTAAIVNGHAVPMSDFRLLFSVAERESKGQAQRNVKALADQAMNQAIAYELVREYAAAHALSVATEVNKRLAIEQRAYGGARSFQQHLARYGLTVNSYRELVQYSLLTQAVETKVAPLITKPQPAAHVLRILILLHPAGKPARIDTAARTMASQILAQLEHGASFAALARQDSDDPSSSRKGGDIGNVFHNQMAPQFEQAVFTLAPRHPAVVHTYYGYEIIEVLSRGQAIAPAPIQRQAQAGVFQAWIYAQMQRSKIQRIARVQA